eukprot:6390099-Prymnesium_polylepis.2
MAHRRGSAPMVRITHPPVMRLHGGHAPRHATRPPGLRARSQRVSPMAALCGRARGPGVVARRAPPRHTPGPFCL